MIELCKDVSVMPGEEHLDRDNGCCNISDTTVQLIKRKVIAIVFQ